MFAIICGVFGRWPLICGHRWRGTLWFRVFGFGFWGKDCRRNPLLFSERNGFDRGVQIGRFRFKVLWPWEAPYLSDARARQRLSYEWHALWKGPQKGPICVID